MARHPQPTPIAVIYCPGDSVFLDMDRTIVMTIEAIFVSGPEMQVKAEASWLHNGSLQRTGWIDEKRFCDTILNKGESA